MLTLKNHFFSSRYQIEQFEFADGTTWDQTDLLETVGIQA
ncbi:MAG: hypothetical protein LBK55_06190 [Azoarcus sp.]|nr:hypothetical protein [Azoarcus sp.]